MSRSLSSQLKLFAYNVFLRPRLIFRDGQLARAKLLPAQLQGYDVLVLSEVFDTSARKLLLEGLRSEYPYSTEPLGEDRFFVQYGGVLILSRWPIEVEEQHLFGRTCHGSDCTAQKGVIYVRFSKNGRRFHLFGTHLQAWPTRSAIEVRAEQLKQLRSFIETFSLPKDEPVLIAGDLNVDRANYPGEFKQMLSVLSASFREPKEGQYTFDPKQNPLAKGDAREFLDYVLYQNDHLAPVHVETEVKRPRVPEPWSRSFGTEFFDLSDHFALSAFLTFR